MNADFGAVFDRSAERLYLIDERGRRDPPDQALLLYLRLLAAQRRRARSSCRSRRRARSRRWSATGSRSSARPRRSQALTQAAAADGVVFAGAPGGGYVFPGFLPAYDAIASLCKLLELLAPVEQPLSELVAALPRPTLIHRQLQCPWALKGTVMRVLNERFADANVDLRDGIKIFDERGWVQVLPDADEPLVHLYAEGRVAGRGLARSSKTELRGRSSAS